MLLPTTSSKDWPTLVSCKRLRCLCQKLVASNTHSAALDSHRVPQLICKKVNLRPKTVHDNFSKPPGIL